MDNENDTEQANGRRSKPRSLPERTSRVFISPTEPNTKFLVKRGPDVANEMLRQDVFVQFSAGVCVVDADDTDRVNWLEAHGSLDETLHGLYHDDRNERELIDQCPNFSICRDYVAPQALAWAELKEQQLALANREPGLPKHIDVDRLLAGDDQRQPSSAIASAVKAATAAFPKKELAEVS